MFWSSKVWNSFPVSLMLFNEIVHINETLWAHKSFGRRPRPLRADWLQLSLWLCLSSLAQLGVQSRCQMFLSIRRQLWAKLRHVPSSLLPAASVPFGFILNAAGVRPNSRLFRLFLVLVWGKCRSLGRVSCSEWAEAPANIFLFSLKLSRKEERLCVHEKVTRLFSFSHVPSARAFSSRAVYQHTLKS